jgi:hypothetical protein
VAQKGGKTSSFASRSRVHENGRATTTMTRPTDFMSEKFKFPAGGVKGQADWREELKETYEHAQETPLPIPPGCPSTEEKSHTGHGER